MKYTSPIQTVTVELPSCPGSQIVMKNGLNTAQQRDLVKTYKDIQTDQSQAIDMGIDAIVMLIQSWNFTDENDQPIPVTKQFVENLSSEDFGFLMGQLNLSGSKKD